jgi:hypothetical protein
MRHILILMVLTVICLKVKSQTDDYKAVYLKFIEEITGKYKWKKDTVLMYDSTANWRAKEDYSLLSLIRRRQKLKTTEWDSVLQNFNLCPQAKLISKYFNLQDFPKIAGAKFRYETEKRKGRDTYRYWRISFSPLYFNVDNTKCVTRVDFFVGKCSNGAMRLLFVQKNKDGVWVDAKPLFAE